MIYRWLYILIIIALCSCKKQITGTDTKLLGHAGNGMTQWNGMFAANSLEGIKYALDLDNCSGVEVDIRLSKDTTFWLVHDTALDNVTNGTGCFYEAADEYLAKIHYQGIHREKLITLQQLIDLHTLKEVVLDLKHYDQCTSVQMDFNFIKRGFEKLGGLPPNFRIKMNTSSIYPYLKDFSIPLIYELTSFSQFVEFSGLSGIYGFMIESDKISGEEIRQIKNEGYKVYLYEVRAISRLKKELKKQPDYILVDDLLNSVMEL